ncbi:MAG: hypothetical protein K8H88_25695 [Sandaracinaceae bacterium]|nr:hypothetical protein [Sandaracinaceae bacterium]
MHIRMLALAICLAASPALAQTTTSGAGQQADGTWRAESDRIPAVESNPDYTRVRFHGGVGGGVFLGNINGGMGGLDFGIGVQFNQYLALFAQSMGMLGAFIDAPALSGAVAAFWFNSILLDVTIAHFLQLGAGPSLDFVGALACDSTAGCMSGSAGPFFGLDGRVALAIGGHDVGTRGAFYVAAHLHPVFYDDGGGFKAVFALLFSLGGMVY